MLVLNHRVTLMGAAAVEYDETQDLNYSNNIKDACRFLSQKINNYEDWLLCGLASASLGEEGRKYFLTLSRNPNYPEDTDLTLNTKYDKLIHYYDKGIEKRVTIATLFYVAKSYGYTDNIDYSCTDKGNRDRFIHLNRNILRYNNDSGIWVYWNDKIWDEDKEGVMSKALDKIDVNLDLKLKYISDKDKKANLLRHIKRTRSRNGREAIIALAKVDARMIPLRREYGLLKDYRLETGIKKYSGHPI